MDWNFGHGIMTPVTFNRLADWKLQSIQSVQIASSQQNQVITNQYGKI